MMFTSLVPRHPEGYCGLSTMPMCTSTHHRRAVFVSYPERLVVSFVQQEGPQQVEANLRSTQRSVCSIGSLFPRAIAMT
jgi:hypothetical protein